jgi:NADP-dependent 3-hydroxy acid dehydrogenase YdfG
MTGCAGGVATELPNSITDPVAAGRVRKFYADAAIPADSFARTVAFAISQPQEVDINEIVFRPTRQELSIPISAVGQIRPLPLRRPHGRCTPES